jgi:hypothetical protein
MEEVEEYCTYMDKIKCPRCKHNHSKDPENLPWVDDDEREFQCNGCDKPFICKANITVNWTTTAEIEDEA